MTITKQTARGRGITASDEVDKTRQSYIGSILMFAVGSCEVPMKEIEQWLKGQNVLMKEDLPKAPTPLDAFQCACSEENIHIWDDLDRDRIAEFEEVYKGEKIAMRYLTLPTARNSAQYVLERRLWLEGKDKEITPQHPNIARITFVAEGPKLQVDMFPEFQDPDLKEQIEKIINKEFKRQQSFVNGTRHRQAIYKLVESVDGIKFLGGMSTYFVPLHGMARIEAFSDYLNTVVSNYRTTGYPCEMRHIEVMDTELRRQEIARDVARMVEEAYSKTLDDTLNYVKTKGKKKMDDASTERALERRLQSMGKNKTLLESYERILETKITIQKKPLKKGNMSGRVKDLIGQMEEMFQ